MHSSTFHAMTSASNFTEAWSTDSLDFTYDNKMLNPCNSRAYLFPDNPNSMRARPGLYEDYTSINKRVKRQQVKDLKTQIARLKETIKRGKELVIRNEKQELDKEEELDKEDLPKKGDLFKDEKHLAREEEETNEKLFMEEISGKEKVLSIFQPDFLKGKFANSFLSRIEEQMVRKEEEFTNEDLTRGELEEIGVVDEQLASYYSGVKDKGSDWEQVARAHEEQLIGVPGEQVARAQDEQLVGAQLRPAPLISAVLDTIITFTTSPVTTWATTSSIIITLFNNSTANSSATITISTSEFMKQGFPQWSSGEDLHLFSMDDEYMVIWDIHWTWDPGGTGELNSLVQGRCVLPSYTLNSSWPPECQRRLSLRWPYNPTT